MCKPEKTHVSAVINLCVDLHVSVHKISIVFPLPSLCSILSLLNYMYGGNIMSAKLMFFSLEIWHNIHDKQISKMFTSNIFQLIHFGDIHMSTFLKSSFRDVNSFYFYTSTFLQISSSPILRIFIVDEHVKAQVI